MSGLPPEALVGVGVVLGVLLSLVVLRPQRRERYGVRVELGSDDVATAFRRGRR